MASVEKNLMSITFKSKVSKGQNYPFPCSDFTIKSGVWIIKDLTILFTKSNAKYDFSFLSFWQKFFKCQP